MWGWPPSPGSAPPAYLHCLFLPKVNLESPGLSSLSSLDVVSLYFLFLNCHLLSLSLPTFPLFFLPLHYLSSASLCRANSGPLADIPSYLLLSCTQPGVKRYMIATPNHSTVLKCICPLLWFIPYPTMASLKKPKQIYFFSHLFHNRWHRFVFLGENKIYSYKCTKHRIHLVTCFSASL